MSTSEFNFTGPRHPGECMTHPTVRPLYTAIFSFCGGAYRRFDSIPSPQLKSAVCLHKLVYPITPSPRHAAPRPWTQSAWRDNLVDILLVQIHRNLSLTAPSPMAPGLPLFPKHNLFRITIRFCVLWIS